MDDRPLDASWKSWLAENLARGCSRTELVDILRAHGFSPGSIRDSMGPAFPAEGLPQHPLPVPRLVRQPLPGLRKVAADALELYTLDDFLSVEECDRLGRVIDRNLRASMVTVEAADRGFRTSRTCDLSLLEDPAVGECDEKIARTLGIRLAYSEGIQGQRYDVGQQFKAHTDYFEPGTGEYAAFGGERGNRTWTFMVFLNEGMVGGATRFLAIDRAIEPKKGLAIIWNNLRRDGTPNAATLHSGEPVVSGHKIIITKWFRELGVGPMLYED